MKEMIAGVMFIAVILSFFLVVMPLFAVLITKKERKLSTFCQNNNSFGIILAAAILVYGLGHFISPAFHIYQLIVLFVLIFWLSVNFPRLMARQMRILKRYLPWVK